VQDICAWITVILQASHGPVVEYVLLRRAPISVLELQLLMQ
jgi:hypothetical protein